MGVVSYLEKPAGLVNSEPCRETDSRSLTSKQFPPMQGAYILLPDGIVHRMRSYLRFDSQYQPRDGYILEDEITVCKKASIFVYGR